TLYGEAGSDTLHGGNDGDSLHAAYWTTDDVDSVNTLNGDAGNDYLWGNEGKDTLNGGADDDQLYGGGNDDTLNGNDGSDYLQGDDGDDTLDGGTLGDTMAGGNGDDTYIVDNANDVVAEQLGEGVDTVKTARTYTLGADLENLVLTGLATVSGTGNGLSNTLTGNAAANTLTGGAGNDTLDGGAGVDQLVGGIGNDVYVVDSTNDLIIEVGGEGTDTVQASLSVTLEAELENLTLIGSAALNGTGNGLSNILTGNGAGNVLDGGAGDDTLDGAVGIDTLIGGLGNDTYMVDNAGDVVIEAPGSGTDTVQSSVNLTLAEEVENLTLTGSAALNGTGNGLANTLTGNSGNNVLNGGAGADRLIGGLGNDTYVIDDAGDTVTEAAGGGTDTVQSSVSLTVATQVENLTLTGSVALNGIGNGLANMLTGNSGNNVLNGGAGADRLIGGLGDDTYVVDSTGDVVTEAVGGGNDTVQSSVSLTLEAEVEDLTLTGSGALNGTGNGLANILTGNSANNVLNGGAGADRLIGGLGNDTYVVDNTGDVVTEAAAGGTDIVQSSVSLTLAAEVENLTLTGSAALNGTGNGLTNILTGNSANNVLNGGAGADRLIGGLGNDTYVVDNAGDLLTEAAAGGTDTVQSSVSLTLAAEVENLTLTGAAALNGTGNSLANTLTGNAANNVLNGVGGADWLIGGLGNDTYVVDNAGDVVTEAAAGGTDTVQSSITLTLAPEVENLTLTGTAALNGTGNSLANTLTGNGGNNVLNGGAGADGLIGGLGNDTYVVDNAGDVVTEAAASGTDTVQSSVSLTLAAEIENLTLMGTAALNGTGNGLANTVTGNGGNNVLNGGAGADRLIGGLGNDTYVVDNTGDVITEAAAGGTDTIQSNVSLKLAAEVENLTLTGTAALNGTGNGLANTLTGNAANNVLNGAGGADRLIGGLGNDTYVVDNTGDVVTEAASSGTDTIQSSVSRTLAAEVENLTLTGSVALNGTGNGLANTLLGNSGNNILNGGAGTDKLTGGLGNDTFFFNSTLSATTNVDSITDFNVANDTIRLENAVFTAIVGTGTLTAAQFVKNTTGLAADASDRIIYESDTGKLFYDSNGNASGGSVHFATVGTNLALTAADFFIV
ncbi:beta strand repeat-containing protein, partial [Sinorhizobium americanum]